MVATPSLRPGLEIDSACWLLLVYVSTYGGGHKGLRGSGRRDIIEARWVARRLQLGILSAVMQRVFGLRLRRISFL